MSHNHKSNNTQNVNYISTYFYAYLPTSKITSVLISNREYISNDKTPFNGTNFYKIQKYVLLTRQYVITNVKYTKQNRIYSYTHYYTHRGIHLHLHQNNITYNSTGKKYSRKNFLIKENTKREV